VIVIGDEIHAPYDRPPLSSNSWRARGTWLASTITLPMCSTPWGSSFRLGRRATGLDLDDTHVLTDDGAGLHSTG